MAQKKNANKKTEEKKTNGYEEWTGTYYGLELNVRMYRPKENKGIKRTFLYITHMGFCIQASFVETSNNYFISFPQYKTDDNKYKSYVFIEKESFWAKALDELAEEIYKRQGGDE